MHQDAKCQALPPFLSLILPLMWYAVRQMLLDRICGPRWFCVVVVLLIHGSVCAGKM